MFAPNNIIDNGLFKFTAKKIPHCCQFEWKIHIPTGYTFIKSPEFCVSNDCPVKWNLLLNVQFIRAYIASFEIKLVASDRSLKKLKVKFYFEFLWSNRVLLDKCFDDFFPFVLENRSINFDLLFSEIKYDVVAKYAIVFKGEIAINNCCQKNLIVEEITSQKYLLQLQMDFKSLFKSQELTDVALNIGNEVIRAHKFVLCARSPVLRRMFEQNFREAADNKIDIKDMKKSDLQLFLEFLYTGVLEDHKFETAAALYSAADKYEVKTLQEACREILTSNLSADKAPFILNLSDMHNDDSLKEIAIEYICDNFVQVEPTTEWENLLDTNPRLASSTLKRVSVKCSKQ